MRIEHAIAEGIVELDKSIYLREQCRVVITHLKDHLWQHGYDWCSIKRTKQHKHKIITRHHHVIALVCCGIGCLKASGAGVEFRDKPVENTIQVGIETITVSISGTALKQHIEGTLRCAW